MKFTIEETNNVGSKFKVVCQANYDLERHLTCGKEYEIEITPKILTTSPLCKVTGDRGTEIECHVNRFEKLGEL